MKTLITKFLALSSVAIVMLASCKKDETKVVAATTATGAALTLSTTTPTLTKATLTNTAVTITASPVTYGYAASVSYALQLAPKGTNFATPTEITLSTPALSKAYNVQDFNNLLLGWKFAVNTPAQVEVRLKTSLSANAGITYSAVQTITATPFPLTSWVYMVGAYQGWSAGTPDSLISVLGDGVYTGIINITGADRNFLLLPAKNFNNKYATTEATTVSPSTKAIYNAGNNFQAPATPGFYVVTMNTNTGTIAFGSPNRYSAIGTTVGDTNSFSIDVPLTSYINDGVTGWTGLVPFNVGTFKVRQNNDWTWSWGVPKASSEGYGVANTLNDSSNDNIPITVAGTYRVNFYIVPSIMGATAAGSTPPSVTAKYSLVKQ